MPWDHRLYLDDILEAVEKIEGCLEKVSFQEFAADSMRVDLESLEHGTPPV